MGVHMLACPQLFDQVWSVDQWPAVESHTLLCRLYTKDSLELKVKTSRQRQVKLLGSDLLVTVRIFSLFVLRNRT
jgi:hypothetical protein